MPFAIILPFCLNITSFSAPPPHCSNPVAEALSPFSYSAPSPLLFHCLQQACILNIQRQTIGLGQCRCYPEDTAPHWLPLRWRAPSLLDIFPLCGCLFLRCPYGLLSLSACPLPLLIFSLPCLVSSSLLVLPLPCLNQIISSQPYSLKVCQQPA